MRKTFEQILKERSDLDLSGSAFDELIDLFQQIRSSTIKECTKVTGVDSTQLTSTLDKNSIKSLKWNKLKYTKPYYFFVPKDFSDKKEYEKGNKIFKTEIEILNSKHSLEELNDMLLNLVNYILVSNVTLKNGETIGFTEDQKLKITISKGKFIDGKTIKVEF